jgi:hypothetical protein
MKRLMVLIFAVCMIGVIMVSIYKPNKSDSGVTAGVPSPSRDSSENHVLVTATNVAPEDDSEFFVYNNGDPADFFEGDQFFGTMDKLGVNSLVMNAYSTEINDFNFIAGRKSDREQFLSAKGINLTNNNSLWQVSIDAVGAVGADIRLKVLAKVGTDITIDGGIQMGIDQTLFEIWKLDQVGNQPVLLDRSLDPFSGFSTHAEVPPSDLTWPDGIQFGSP